MSATIDELRAIADAVCELRPDWSAGGVLNVLTAVRDRGRVDEISRAAQRAANDPTSRTPSAIEFPAHWIKSKPAAVAGASNNGNPPLPECSECGVPALRETSARLRTCPSCFAPWVPIVFADDRDEARRRAVPPNAEFRAACTAIFGSKQRGGEPTSLGDILAPAKRALDDFGDW